MFVFLIGTGRCGSTLVHELLARHPGIGFVSNVEDRLPGLPARAGRLNNVMYRRIPPTLTRKGRIRFAPSEAYQALAREVSPLVTEPSRDLVAADAMPWLAERFRGFFVDRALAQGKPVFVHKFTGWPRTGFIREVLGDVRFFNVVRDGRAFTASTLQMPWDRGYLGPEQWRWGPLPPAYAEEWEASGRSFPLLVGLGWKVMMDAYDAARALVPDDRWLDVRFEDVLAEPEASLKELLGFMDLDPDPAFDAALSRTAFVAGRRDAYQRVLDPASVALLEASLAGHLGRWGYLA
jgi:hypothetical protein